LFMVGGKINQKLNQVGNRFGQEQKKYKRPL